MRQSQMMLVHCDPDGSVTDVSPLIGANPFTVGAPFETHLEEASQVRYFDFLKDLHEHGCAFGCEIRLNLAGRGVPYMLNGYLDEQKMHLILMQNAEELPPVLSDMIRINNKQLNELRTLRKERQDADVSIYEEISKLNSELLNSKRIIDKQNAELTKYNQLLKNLSERDVLTDAYNRRYFYDYCKNVLCHDASLFPICLISIDFNNFKFVNDRFGHDAGDRVLVEFVRIVKKTVSTQGDIFRFGGDEFIIVLRQASLDEAERMMEEIVRAFAAYNQIVTIAYGSVEVASTTDVHECEMLRFLNAADLLMYDRKREMKERTRC
ncbi:MAG: hypothetical protein A2Y16_03255 [Tenericutes bacterium GWF2_57_13]|nr:MAG: hypothetical protein A2Y16_03255 [Tenericutes bacterium GWF2_57_13]